ncbi:MAG: phage terminase large subunit family protein [Planctomycetaceae bacterium]|jgi:hypothetical protein|nr:phage terminase large subunit family protein [Planctomycetaceae bacterium]
MIKATELNYVELAKNKLTDLRSNFDNWESLLPLLFNLHGKPVTLENHFPMRPLFDLRLPAAMTLKTGRQVGKSAHNSLQTIIHGKKPHSRILHVFPLAAMSDRFSKDYLAAALNESPLKGLFINGKCVQSKDSRTFINKTILYFTHAFYDCTRTRGINATELKLDEIQDLDPEFLEILYQTLSGARAGKSYKENSENKDEREPFILHAGTPKTFDNILEVLWNRSSCAEWIIPCRRCGRQNIPTMTHDLEKMMGPESRSEDISPKAPGIVCAKCGHYLWSEDGDWVHAFPKLKEEHAGYHIPQQILPFHNKDPKAWSILQTYRLNRERMSLAGFHNEVCGESYDLNMRLFTVTDIRNAAVLPDKHEFQTHIKWINENKYQDWLIGVDWGGGGLSGISTTSFALCGLRPNGIIEVFSGYRSSDPNNFNLEARRLKDTYVNFKARAIACDFQGAGRMRFDKLLEIGLPVKNLYPIEFGNLGNGAVAKHVRFNKKENIPEHHELNKTRGLLLMSHLIKSAQIRFFEYDNNGENDPGLLRDFSNLVEDKFERKGLGEIYRIMRDPRGGSDDFAMACLYGSMGLYIRNGFPKNIGGILSRADLSEEQQKAVDPNFMNDMSFDWFFKKN